MNEVCTWNDPVNFDCSTRQSWEGSQGGNCRNSQSQPMQTTINPKPDPNVNQQNGHDYNKAVHLSILFYEAQQSGVLSEYNRIPWRNHANLYDGCDAADNQQQDLRGGWYDAGDNVKFHHPMSQSAVALFFGAIEFYDSLWNAGEKENMEHTLKFITDYFLKTHPSPNVYYGQVGIGDYDHNNYARPEYMNDQCRPIWKCDESHPCTEPAAETAAALAAAFIFFDKQNYVDFPETCLEKAISLITYADNFRDKYTNSIPDAQSYYGSFGGYFDELVDGYAWIAKAYDYKGDEANKNFYLQKAMDLYDQNLDNDGDIWEYSWDDKTASALLNLAELSPADKADKYWRALDNFVNYKFVNRPETTNFGIPWVSQWGSNRYSANLAFIGMMAAKKHHTNNKPWSSGLDEQTVINKCKMVAHYILGDNPINQSYLIGYGNKYPQYPHHKSSACPKWGDHCGWETWDDWNGPNPHILYGAMVGGPDKNDQYNDLRSDYVSNEVTTDYNAGFTSLILGLKDNVEHWE